MPAQSRAATILFWFLCLAVALASLRFLPWGVERTMEFVAYHAIERQWMFFTHVTLGPLALAVMPFQFSHRLRRNRPGVHRWLGRVYGVAILVSGLAGLAMALGTQAGTFAGIGFGLLAIAWLGTTGIAISHAMAGRIADHQRWIVRSAALTFAAVTLRIELPILAMTLGMETGYPYVAWLCWVPNLLVAEWWLRRRPAPRPQVA